MESSRNTIFGEKRQERERQSSNTHMGMCTYTICVVYGIHGKKGIGRNVVFMINDINDSGWRVLSEGYRLNNVDSAQVTFVVFYCLGVLLSITFVIQLPYRTTPDWDRNDQRKRKEQVIRRGELKIRLNKKYGYSFIGLERNWTPCMS